MRLRRIAILALLATAAAAPAAPRAKIVAPHVATTSFERLPTPLPLPYDEKADANAQIAAARMRAAKAGKRLLIDLGGNWCLDCRLLAGTIELPEMKRFVARHFVVVTVDIGRFDKNGQVASGYGVQGRLKGVPAVLIVDPRTNRLLNAGHETELADARSMGPQALADWLAKWAA
jgi:thiol-disulfide isomerase/thioredoxin